MNINVSGIRASIKTSRLEYLLQQLATNYGDGAYSGADILKLERELHGLRRRDFYIDQGQAVLVEKGAVDLPKKIVIRQNDETGATERFEKEVASYNAYFFLEDYLGLGVKPPFSVNEIAEKYPELFAHANGDVEYFEKIAETLLSNVGKAIFKGKYVVN